MSADPSFSASLFDLINDTPSLLLVAVEGLVAGAVLLQFSSTVLSGRLALFFGAQSFMSVYMGWIMTTAVTVPEGTLVDGLVLVEPLRGCPARIALNALQQVVGLLLVTVAVVALCCTSCKYVPRRPSTLQETLLFLLYGSSFALTVVLNSLNLGSENGRYMTIGANLVIRSYLPLATEIFQRLLAGLRLYTRPSSSLVEALLMTLSVISAGAFTTAKLMASGNWSETPHMYLGVFSCLLSLFFEALNFVLAGVLGEMKFKPIETVAYMAVPASVILSLAMLQVHTDLPGEWPLALRSDTASHLQTMLGTWHVSHTATVHHIFAGVVNLVYSLNLVALAQTLTPACAAFATIFNKGALVFLTLLFPFLHSDSLPGPPFVYWMRAAVLVNVVAFVVYFTNMTPPEVKEEEIEEQEESDEEQGIASPASSKLHDIDSPEPADIIGTEAGYKLDPEATPLLDDVPGDAKVVEDAPVQEIGSIGNDEYGGVLVSKQLSGPKEEIMSSRPVTPQKVESRPTTPTTPTKVEEKAITTPRVSDWTRLGGEELEESIQQGWVRLVRVEYLLHLAQHRGVLQRRQEMPEDAFTTLRALQRAKAGRSNKVKAGQGESLEWLPIIVLSYPWLTKSHPDPLGQTLQLVAKACSVFPRDHSILIDYTALHQAPRSAQEEELYTKALSSMNLFYSHQHTVVFKATGLPADSPRQDPYAKRGWCFAESAMSELSKDDSLIWDLSNLPSQLALTDAMAACATPRQPPLSPEDFNKKLAGKVFAKPDEDGENVQRLYLQAFNQRIKTATSLQFCALNWTAEQARQLFSALKGTGVQQLRFQLNDLGDEGGCVIGEALGSNPALKELDLRLNSIGPKGTTAIAEALASNGSLQDLDLRDNNVGDEGAKALGKALGANETLLSLGLHSNGVGPAGALALAEALQANVALMFLDLSWNLVADEGVNAIAKALAGNRALQHLDVHGNGLTFRGVESLAEALCKNRALQCLDLSWNRAGVEGARALAEALERNNCLRQLTLTANHVGTEGAQALAKALQTNGALRQLDLSMNFMKSEGQQALAAARGFSGCSIKL